MLTALERIQLVAQLNDLMVKQKAGSGLAKLQLTAQINDVMTRLGYGQSSINSDERSPNSGPTPAQVQDKEPVTPAEADPVTNEVPEIVTNFLSGKFLNDTKDGIVGAIKQVGDYLGKFITLEQIKDQASQWMDKQGYVFSER